MLTTSKMDLYEILDFISSVAPANRSEAIKTHWCPALQAVVECTFHPAVIWKLPPGTPPYISGKESESVPYSNLHTESKKLYRFLQCGTMVQNPAKREKLFINLLENVHPREAELILMMKARRFTGKWACITPAVVREAFPSVLPDDNGAVPEPVVEPVKMAEAAELGNVAAVAPKKKGRKQRPSEGRPGPRMKPGPKKKRVRPSKPKVKKEIGVVGSPDLSPPWEELPK